MAARRGGGGGTCDDCRMSTYEYWQNGPAKPGSQTVPVVGMDVVGGRQNASAVVATRAKTPATMVTCTGVEDMSVLGWLECFECCLSVSLFEVG